MENILRKLLNKLRGVQSIDKLVKRGLKIGKNFQCMDEVIIDSSHCFHISIGDNVILAPRVHILAHDASTKLFLNYTKIGNVTIGNNVFVGAGTIILPGTSIGDNVVIGAASVVTKDIPENSLAYGNPVRVICSLSQYLGKEKSEMKMDNTFDEEYTFRNQKFNEMHKRELVKACQKYGKAFLD